jgi:hypothetical protein
MTSVSGRTAGVTVPRQGQQVTSRPPYPVTMQGRLDEPLSRGLWLVKWLLAIPHYIVLALLWLAMLVVWPVSLVAVLVTGRYPRGLFDFTVGVLRWSWRVSFYTYSALGTDKYPPFSLADDPAYPARLDVTYPGQLSRGLALVKWWLLALPHYLIIGVFLGGSMWVNVEGYRRVSWPGLIGVLVVIAAVALLFTGRYPRSLFDLVVGLNRWCLRVAGYALLLTDSYPPFRLDDGPVEPSDGGPPYPVEAPAAAAVGVAAPTATAGPYPAAYPAPPVGPYAPPPTGVGPARPGGRWTGGRIAALVVGAVLALIGLGLTSAGGLALWADQTQRDAAGYLTTGTERFSTTTSALTSESVDLRTEGPDFLYAERLLGDVRLRASSSRPVFVGIGPQDAVARYLAGVAHEEVGDLTSGQDKKLIPGNRPPAAPTAQSFWVASGSGAGRQSVTWKPRDGLWTVVVMNADGSPGVVADVDAGATVPGLDTLAVVLLVVGGLLLLGGLLAVVLALVRSNPPRA